MVWWASPCITVPIGICEGSCQKFSFKCHSKTFCSSPDQVLHSLGSQVRKTKPTLNETRQNLASRLQKRMPYHNLQKPLQALPSMLNNIVTKSIRKHLPRQRRNRNSSALPLENIAKVLKVRVTSAHNAMVELEGGDVGSADDLVVGVHVAAHAVRTWVLHLVVGC